MLQQEEIRIPIAISLGAIAGALSRYYLTLWFTNRFGFAFPYGTFFINVSGCLGMGFFATLAMEKTALISPEIKLIVATGFLGAYTTFSTFGLDTVGLLQRGNWLSATSYLLGSIMLGIISVQLGMIIARIFN
ncbi:fluoride efflux transporter CrcB [Dolichospermum sp. FACHB-1091]|uniref:fluoride efflux transporter CrcB n=1 Tax=Dolichospermum sp. FACHB-1091 TaxID=2692798 RepID=UPI001680AF2C|nr:fluoride efflux transporter CrcB [Dolichospermum sp. FACHB-1091]MBD2444175.1 fluoride efflux transporter CrcB [Dolichospermum sp. FACHB-1091]